ncbi:MAG: endolytic transglycosylase MltG [Capsulimonadaceae bacterium]
MSSENDKFGSTRRIMRTTVATLAAFVLSLCLLIGALAAIYLLTPLSSNPKAAVTLVIVPGGASDRKIGEILERAHVIRRAVGFVIAAHMEGVSGNMVAGSYEFSPAQSPRAIAVAIALGRTTHDLLTVPEGFTARQIARRLAARGMANEDEFLKLATTMGQSFHVEGFVPPSRNLEGYLFPDTYLIPRGTSERGIIEMMLGNFRRRVFNLDGGMLASRPSMLPSTITMASLIEREAKIEPDRPKIAAALENRLRRGMKLECDASVEYGLPSYKERLYLKDLKVDTPYNTYLHAGLPPTPIANPGLPSIEAALHPAHVNYLYYVARGDSSHGHIFSETMAQHLKAVALVRAQGAEAERRSAQAQRYKAWQQGIKAHPHVVIGHTPKPHSGPAGARME